MTEKQLYALLTGILGTSLTAIGSPWSTVAVRQAYQPLLTGTPSGPFLGLSNQPMRRYGFLERFDTWDAVHSVMTHTESQKWTVIFQIDSQWKQDPIGAPDEPTAGDLAQTASSIMQSDATRATLLAAGVGIDRVTDVKQPPFKDDTDGFEYAPSFDFCLSFTNTIASASNPATPKAGIYPI